MTPRAASAGRADYGTSISALALCVVLGFYATACAPKRPSVLAPQPVAVAAPIDSADIIRAGTLVREGCYDCLLDARTLYRRLAQGPTARHPDLISRLFEVELLIALREKELAIDANVALARASTIAAALPVSFEAQRLVAMVDAVLPESYGVPGAKLQVLRIAQSDFIAKAGEHLAWLEASWATREFKDYLAFALDCSYPTRTPSAGEAARPLSLLDQMFATAAPLIQYRVAVCKQTALPLQLRTAQLAMELVTTSELSAARDTVPRFVETSYYRAIPELVDAEETGGADADKFLREAYARFRQSPSITYLLGSLNLVIGDCEQALRFFEETIALAPEHEPALLGRTNCLTQQKRDVVAIASATRMVELNTYNVQQAYYFRAVNYHRRGDLTEARSNIELAKEAPITTGRGQAEILTLAGIIEYEQDALDEAENDLRRARAGYGGDFNCSAAWYLGRVFVKREVWNEAVSNFELAMNCYDYIAQQTAIRIEQVRARANMEPTYKARRLAQLEASLPDTRSQYHASAFNAANYSVRAGNKVRARELLEIAAKDPALSDVVARLREAVK